jgi:hypothetical protein
MAGKGPGFLLNLQGNLCFTSLEANPGDASHDQEDPNQDTQAQHLLTEEQCYKKRE